MNEVDFYLEDLKSKFTKIDFNDYYLSYSGGRDSHFLYWFIKKYLKDDIITIVSVNTRMEYPVILRRILDNADKVLLPDLKPHEVKAKWGSPCFTKQQDQLIKQYQHGKHSKSLMRRINGLEGKYSLSKKAKELLLNVGLHNISDKCCYELKKKPFKKYYKQSGKKAILGVRSSEGVLRKTQYQKCFHKNGKFTPIWDLTDSLLKQIEEQYLIVIPEIYAHVDRTGCVGCPYGGKVSIEKGIEYVSIARRKFLKEYFKESYEVKGIIL